MRYACVLFLVAGCGNGDPPGGGSSVSVRVTSYEQAADLAVEVMTQYGVLLDSVTDKASAEAAKPRVEALAARLQGIVAGVEKLGAPDEGAARRSAEKMQATLEWLSPKGIAYMTRVMENPEIAQALGGGYDAAQGHLMWLRGNLGG